MTRLALDVEDGVDDEEVGERVKELIDTKKNPEFVVGVRRPFVVTVDVDFGPVNVVVGHKFSPA